MLFVQRAVERPPTSAGRHQPHLPRYAPASLARPCGDSRRRRDKRGAQHNRRSCLGRTMYLHSFRTTHPVRQNAESRAMTDTNTASDSTLPELPISNGWTVSKNAPERLGIGPQDWNSRNGELVSTLQRALISTTQDFHNQDETMSNGGARRPPFAQLSTSPAP